MTQKQRHERSRERILDAFLALENRQDIHTLNVSALCEEAGTSRTTFYKYFGSVNDVADSVMDRMLDRASPF